jgi:hypothetical protein
MNSEKNVTIMKLPLMSSTTATSSTHPCFIQNRLLPTGTGVGKCDLDIIKVTSSSSRSRPPRSLSASLSGTPARSRSYTGTVTSSKSGTPSTSMSKSKSKSALPKPSTAVPGGPCGPYNGGAMYVLCSVRAQLGLEGAVGIPRPSRSASLRPF